MKKIIIPLFLLSLHVNAADITFLKCDYKSNDRITWDHSSKLLGSTGTEYYMIATNNEGFMFPWETGPFLVTKGTYRFNQKTGSIDQDRREDGIDLNFVEVYFTPETSNKSGEVWRTKLNARISRETLGFYEEYDYPSLVDYDYAFLGMCTVQEAAQWKKSVKEITDKKTKGNRF